jgi:hypothetical protein
MYRSNTCSLLFVIQKVFTSFDSLRNKLMWKQTMFRAWLYTDSAARCFGTSCWKSQGRLLTSESRLLFQGNSFVTRGG